MFGASKGTKNLAGRFIGAALYPVACTRRLGSTSSATCIFLQDASADPQNNAERDEAANEFLCVVGPIQQLNRPCPEQSKNANLDYANEPHIDAPVGSSSAI
jgi:hypothetical protein